MRYPRAVKKVVIAIVTLSLIALVAYDFKDAGAAHNPDPPKWQEDYDNPCPSGQEIVNAVGHCGTKCPDHLERKYGPNGGPCVSKCPYDYVRDIQYERTEAGFCERVDSTGSLSWWTLPDSIAAFTSLVCFFSGGCASTLVALLAAYSFLRWLTRFTNAVNSANGR